MAYGSVIAADWLPIVVALVASWVLGLAAVGLSAQALTRWTERRGARGGAT